MEKRATAFCVIIRINFQKKLDEVVWFVVALSFKVGIQLYQGLIKRW